MRITRFSFILLLLATTALANGGPKGAAKPIGHVVNLQMIGSTVDLTRFVGNSATFVFEDAVLPANLATLTNLEAGSDPRTACTTAAMQWVNNSTVSFTDNGTVSSTQAGSDGTNLVTFENHVTNNAVVGGALAVALVSFNGTFQITDADVVFSSAISYTTLGTSTLIDVQSVATHEFGHCFGLNHSGVCSSTMFPFTANGTIHQRTLSKDDIAGINGVYQEIPHFWSTGTISGTITRNAINVYGAHVVARSVVDGTTVAAGISQTDGTYTITGLPTGPYIVYAEPFDGPVGDANIQSSFYTIGKDTSFQTTFHGGNMTPTMVAVIPAIPTTAVDIAVGTAVPALNLTQIGELPGCVGGFSVSSGGFEITPGTNTFLIIAGPSVDTFADSFFSVASQGISFGPASCSSGSLGGGVGFKVFPFNVAADAEPGPRDVMLDDGTEVSIYCGVVDISPASSPVATSFSFGTSSSGTGGQPVLSASVAPTIPEPALTLDVVNGVNGETAFYFGAAEPDFIDMGNGVIQWIRVPGADLFPTAGLSAPVITSTASLPFPIPNLPNLAGLHVYMQVALSDAAATPGLSSTNCLVLVLNP